MTEDKYRKITECISGIKHGPKMVRLLDQLVTMIIFLLYPVLLGELYLLDRSDLLLPVLVVPATGFVVVSLMRHVIHSKRPYEVYDFTPIIQKETVEHSFPSRHVCSAVLIAMAFLQLDVSNGLEILLLAAILSALRVLGGVHFPKDVIAGYLMGLGFSLLGYYLVFNILR
ncbi:MAG: phosphatase PAP2 family protein [Lachnospiraceae bacterium]|nr:phosphatase PAP2 family protein [Lachnospiraceae bacterium]